ncbi:hypothetical protein Mevan_1632 [Methanococcus vannielii SB]|uniref:Uncharacterized protein n=1 Tax=Methanococcus vannielii (strain ATCC 35089 / DSM 1224 / JCM 13029 / OCM 148 / SB) TaxID=406327 RepID=A6USQ2_METVS|nr:hypothetical protein [Methanococcus vannielii]ABR55524.1 hypothetical protein Mevan_1632 [Methanococcus vannielii SB]
MADIKTHLRELSVIAGILYTISEKNINELYQMHPKDFFKYLSSKISNDISNASNITYLPDFNNYKSIMCNGINLGKKIVDLGIVDDYTKIYWLGSDSQKNDPVDLKVGNTGFSLKEESYILENMGLYKYLNTMTNSKFERGLHIFENFAEAEYAKWFEYTWNSMLGWLKTNNNIWSLTKNDKTSEIKIVNSEVQFIINGTVISKLPNRNISVKEYIEHTDSKSREKVFSKWINSKFKKDKKYIDLKNICSQKAGSELCNYISRNYNPVGLARFLQIYENGYYYAKTTEKDIEIYYVPSISEFEKDIEIDKIEYSIPKSQLNIITTVKNKITGNSLEFRNECRFSHGQFNGTPEAKMYYGRNTDLSDIYEKKY